MNILAGSCLRRLLFLLFFVITVGKAETINTDDLDWFIPDGIVYIKEDVQINETSRKQLLKTFNRHEKGLYKLAKKQSGYFFLGPLLSSRIKEASPRLTADLRSAGYRIKITADFEPKFNGLLAKTNNEKKLLSQLLSIRIGDTKDIRLRRPKPDELAFMWYFISWDIKEPVFVLETDKHTFLVDLGAISEDQLWIEEISNPCYRFGFEDIISPCLCFEVILNGKKWSAGFTEAPLECTANVDKQAQVSHEAGVPNSQSVILSTVHLLSSEEIIQQNFTARELADWMDKITLGLNKSVPKGQKGQIAIEVLLKVQGKSDYNIGYQEHIDENWLITVSDLMEHIEYLKPKTDEIEFVMIFDVDTE